MKKQKYIILLVTILLPALYQKAPAQVYGHSALNSVSGGSLTQRRGSSMLSVFTHYSTGSDRFQQTLNRQPDPLAARMSVNRLAHRQTPMATGLTRRVSAYGLSSQINSSTRNSPLTAMSGYRDPSRTTNLTSGGTSFNVRAYSSASALNYSQPRRFLGGPYLSGRPFANYPSIFTSNLTQSTMKPTLLDNRGFLSNESYSLANRKTRSEIMNTRLSMTNSFLGSVQSSPFLRVRKY